ncbi:MAG: hypothetical protein ACKOB8_05240 [Mycobacterium sp.]
MPVMTDGESPAESPAAPTDDTADDTPDTVDDAPDAGLPEQQAPPHPGRVRRLLAAGAAAGLLAVLGALGWQVVSEHQLTRAAQEAQRTAVDYAQVLTSIDSDNVDENFREVLDGATGEFKDMYSASSGELRQLLIDNKATAHGVVIDSAVQSISKDRAVVLLFVDQSVSNTKLPDPRIDRSRMKMTLQKVDGRWRASKVELP